MVASSPTAMQGWVSRETSCLSMPVFVCYVASLDLVDKNNFHSQRTVASNYIKGVNISERKWGESSDLRRHDESSMQCFLHHQRSLLVLQYIG